MERIIIYFLFALTPTLHACALKTYLDQNPEKVIFDLLFTDSRINEHTSVPYATGAVIADMSCEKKEIKGIKAFLAISRKDLKEEVPELLGIFSENEFKKAYSELKQYE